MVWILIVWGRMGTGYLSSQVNGTNSSQIVMSPRKHRGRAYLPRPNGDRLFVIDRHEVCPCSVWKLQTLGSERLEFLYANAERGDSIQLNPGVAYCFRAFHPVLCGLFQAAWVTYLRRTNTSALGYSTDLQEFLFGHERASLDVYKPILREVQKGACFYCSGSLSSSADVDHFIPWSRCHSDLAHNFVLAHRGCNAAKSDHLAFERHLESWARRNSDLGVELDQRFEAAALIHDVNASVSIARWAYSYVEGARGQVWIKANQFKHLDDTWREFLAS